MYISESKKSFIQRHRQPFSEEKETGGDTEWGSGVYQGSQVLWCEIAMGKKHTASDCFSHY